MQKGYTTFMSTERGFAPILIVLLVGIIVTAIGGAYYLGFDHGFEKSVKSQPSKAPQVDETDDWKTYTDPGSRLLFKYPLDWTINFNDAGQFGDVFAARTESPDIHSSQGVLDKGYSVTVNYQGKTERSIEDLEKFRNKDSRIKDFTKTNLNGHEALKFLFQPPGTANRFEYIVIAFGHEIQFWCYFALSDPNGLRQCETIGSTLKILK